MTFTHLQMLHEAVELNDRFPDLPDYEVIESVCEIANSKHLTHNHDTENCVTCRSIIKAYDEGLNAAKKYVRFFTN